jgi:hypothetical protein
VVPSVPVSSDATRRLRARVQSLEAALARLTAAAPIPPQVVPVDVAPRFVENLNSLVVHQFRHNSHLTVCGWNTTRASASLFPMLIYNDASILDERPWRMICERCCSTEREIARLAAPDSIDTESE